MDTFGNNKLPFIFLTVTEMSSYVITSRLMCVKVSYFLHLNLKIQLTNTKYQILETFTEFRVLFKLFLSNNLHKHKTMSINLCRCGVIETSKAFSDDQTICITEPLLIISY